MTRDLRLLAAGQALGAVVRRPRVASWDTLASFLGMPLGYALAGPVSDALGTDRTLLGCAAVIFRTGVSPLLVRGTRTLPRLEPEPAAA